VTSELDRWEADVQMLQCELQPHNLYPTPVLAMRDLRHANGRDPETGEGEGNESWIALSLGMIALDTMSGRGRRNHERRWKRLLKAHGVSDEDAKIIYALRCSLLHGYGLPKPEDACGRRVVLTGSKGYAVDTSRDGLAIVSVPVFCGRLVERVVHERPEGWDVSVINVAATAETIG
jgi:hypothetical protein